MNKKSKKDKKRDMKHPKVKRMNLAYLENELSKLTGEGHQGCLRFKQMVDRLRFLKNRV